VVLVNARVAAIGTLPPSAPQAAARPAPTTPAERRISLDGVTQLVPVHDFATLTNEVAGPAIIESDTTTVLLLSGDWGRMNAGQVLDVTIGVGA